MDASALWGIIDGTPKANLSAKVALVEADTPEGLAGRLKRVEELIAAKSPAEALIAVGAINEILGRLEMVEARLATIEDKSSKSFNVVGEDMAALRERISELGLKLQALQAVRG